LDRGREEKGKESKGVKSWQKDFKFAGIAEDSQQKRFVQTANQQTFQQAGKEW
jgi:hypothetical protein